MNRLTNHELSKELKTFRLSIELILCPEFRDLLMEIEKRLGGKSNMQKSQVSGKRKRPTKKDIFNRYFYK